MRIKTMGMAVLLLLPSAPGIVAGQTIPDTRADVPTESARPTNQAVVRSARRPDHSRIAIDFPGSVPAFEATRTPTGYEVRFRGRQPFNLAQFKPVADVSGATVVRDGQDSVLRLTLPCPCEVETLTEARTLRFIVRRSGSTPAPAPLAGGQPPSATAPSTSADAPIPALSGQPSAATVPAAPVRPGPAPTSPSPAQIAPAGSPPPAAAQTPAAIRVRTARRPDHARLALDFPGALPPIDVRNTPTSIEVRIRGTYRLDMDQFRPLSEVAGLTVDADGRESVVRIALDCQCAVSRETSPGTVHFMLRRISGRPTPSQAAPAANQGQTEALRSGNQPAAAATAAAPPTPAPAASPAVSPTVSPGPPAPTTQRGRQRLATSAPSAEEVDQLRNSIVRQLGVLNGTVPPAPAATSNAAGTTPQAEPQPRGPHLPGAEPGASAATSTPTPAGPAPRAPSSASASNAAAAAAAAQRAAQAPRAAPARPACAPDFDPGEWGGSAPGTSHADRLVALRAALATSGEAPDDAAALAEFLVGQGLLPEAQQLLRDRINGDLAEVTRLRLERVRDVARLLMRRPIDPGSPLLVEKPHCEREDLALWQALTAAAQNNSAMVTSLLPKVQRGLRAAPDRLRMAYAFALSDAVQDDADALRALVAPIRTVVPGTEAEDAERHLLLARIAALAGARDEERLHLRRAAQATRTVPGLFAMVRLAARDAERPGPQTPESKRAEEQLVEIARTYRHDRLGEEASVLYAHLLLSRDNMGGALLAADAASAARGRTVLENRGAILAARILRLLLVDPEGRTLPSAEERLAMFWGFEGYATPGERGDDIRMGAARLMLDRDLADAALEVVREFSAATMRTPAGALLIARAEALAPEGDAQKALAILRAQDFGEPGRRIAAQALARLNRPSDAANELGGLRDRTDLGNRGRYLFLAQRWTEAANTYAELLRDPALDAPQRTEATGRYATAAALSPRPVTRVPAELLSPADSGTRSLLLLQAHEPPARTAQTGARIDLILNAIDRAKRIEAMATTSDQR